MLASVAMPAAAETTVVRTQAEYANAAKRLRPGDTIVLANGEWRDFQIVFTGQGAADKPITLTAETKGKVFITGQSNLRLGGRHLVVSGLVFREGHSPTEEVIAFRRDSKTPASDSRLTEVVIDGFNPPSRTKEDRWVSLYGERNRIDHSHFEGKANAGVTLAVIRNEPRADNHRIDHNYFGPRPVLGSNGGETIRIGTSDESLSDSSTIVERNIFEGCDGEVEIVSVKSGGNIVRGNLFLASQGALVLRHGNGNLVERNVFLGKGKANTGGIRVINRDQIVRGNYIEGTRGVSFLSAVALMNGVPNSKINRYHQVADAVIANNSLIDVARVTWGAGADAERSAPPIDTRIADNLIVGADGKDPVRVETDLSGVTFAGNVNAAERSVKLERGANGLLYPTDPALAGIGAPHDLVVVKRAEVGAAWYGPAPEAAFGSGRTIAVPAGGSIAKAAAKAESGDTLALAKGDFRLAAPVAVADQLTITGAGAATRLLPAGDAFSITGGGGLRLANLSIAGGANAIAVEPSATANYAVELADVQVSGLSGDVLKTAAGTMARRVAIGDSRFAGIAGAVVAGAAETGGKGTYSADRVTIADSRFENVGMVADLLRKGTDESTTGPTFAMTGSTVTASGKGGASVRLSGVQTTSITGNRFVRSGPIAVTHSVGTPSTAITGNRFAATPAPRIEELHYRGPDRARITNNIMENAQ
ncbi:poly(beta-D-mannuronate) lyase [Sphingomonas gilva]|uniref:Poly(Beta-D-mannuronate) lyase n=2 Tax=Sphingomonas gilva TaxID=2305907 RepID=A0A396RPE6_9SPHN|nr:poly(beta-D-mannuronate) lyase [Sphingomonas gilva]